jgi:hypothetical protein
MMCFGTGMSSTATHEPSPPLFAIVASTFSPRASALACEPLSLKPMPDGGPDLNLGKTPL